MTDTDGIDETFEHTLRTALMAAARAGETVTRLREQQQRGAEARSRQEATELHARFSAEQAAARAHYEQARYPDWWDRASLDDVVATYQTAAAWADVDPQAAAAKQHIEQQARTRHDIDITAPDPVAAAGRAEHAGAAADQQTARARGEELEAAALLAAADTADRNSAAAAAAGDPAGAEQDRNTAADLTTQAGHLYDSAERRNGDAERLSGVADAATVDARVRADTSQAQPASHATRDAPARDRRPRGRSPQRQRTPATRSR